MAAARLQSESMSKVDAAWLHMESPTNMMMITGVMMFDRPVDFQRLLATYEHRMAGMHPRFKQRVREGGLIGGPRWEEDPHFTLSQHVHRIALPAPGDQTTLQELVGDLMSTPLDRNKPLWQVHLVEGYGEGCAVVTRLAHAYADGIALMGVLLNLTDATADAPWPEAPRDDADYRPPIWTRILVPTMTAVDSTLRLGETMIHESMETLVHPDRLMGVAKAGAGAARFGVGYTLALSKLLLLGPDQRTAFKGKLGVTKRAAWTQPMPLADVKAVGKLLCGTINDVLLTCVAGGLRRYLIKRGQPTGGVDIRAMVPVNLRRPEEQGQLGNRFGLIYVGLPVGLEDPLVRLRVLKRRMDDIKNTPEALVAFDILNTIGFTPNQMEKVFTSIFAMKATAVMTNVPGPRQTLYLAGTPLRQFIFWVPTSADLALGVSIFSYDGQVTIGISVDAGLVPDPEGIAAGIEAEFQDMRDYVRYARIEECSEDETGLPLESGAGFTGLATIDEKPCADAATDLERAAAAVLTAATARPERGARPERARRTSAAPREAATEVEPGMCQAVTKSGQPCRNRALPGQTTCRIHAAA
jgi:diacylglycerol O-acyltransferase / wax synthase